MQTLVIIPARGGSKGIKNKNIYNIDGFPLIYHTIKHAKYSEKVDRIVVSTDSQEIEDISKSWGAEIIVRPSKISRDDDPTELALKHALDHLLTSEYYKPDLVVMLQVTSPLRSMSDIDKAISFLQKENADSCFSAYREHFVGRWIKGKDSAIPLNYYPTDRPMRQNYTDRFIENGSIYIFKPWVLEKTGCRLGGKIVIYEMDKIKSLQIDTIEDIKIIKEIINKCTI